MKARGAVIYGGWPVAWVVVQEGAAPFQLVFEVGQLSAAGAAIFIVLATDRESDPVASGDDNRGRPDLDIEFRDLVLLQRPLFVVGVIGPVGLRQFLVELAVRSAKPSLPNRRVRIDRTLEHDFLKVAGEHA